MCPKEPIVVRVFVVDMVERKRGKVQEGTRKFICKGSDMHVGRKIKGKALLEAKLDQHAKRCLQKGWVSTNLIDSRDKISDELRERLVETARADETRSTRVLRCVKYSRIFPVITIQNGKVVNPKEVNKQIWDGLKTTKQGVTNSKWVYRRIQYLCERVWDILQDACKPEVILEKIEVQFGMSGGGDIVVVSNNMLSPYTTTFIMKGERIDLQNESRDFTKEEVRDVSEMYAKAIMNARE